MLNGVSQVSVEFTKLSVEPKDQVFSIMPGTFYDCVIPETVASLWGPIPLERLPEAVDNSCRYMHAHWPLFSRPKTSQSGIVFNSDCPKYLWVIYGFIHPRLGIEK